MILGGDPATMRHLAAQFRNEALQVQQLTQRVSVAVTGTTWTGPAADRFRQEWDGTFRSVLVRLEESLQANAAHVDGRVQAIEQATA